MSLKSNRAVESARIKPAAPRVLMIGTALNGKGGVAAVIEVLKRDGLFEREAVRYLSTHQDGSRLAKAGAAMTAFGRAAWCCLRQRPAVVHAHSASRASFARKSVVLLIARVTGCRTIFHLHGGEFHKFAAEESGPLLRWWIRHTLRQSSVVIALSDSWADFLRRYAPGARVLVIPNSVAVPAANPDRALEVPGRILFLGRAEAGKGVFELLDAVAALAPAFPDVHLVIGASGDLAQVRRHAAELGIVERLMLPGWLGPSEKADELSRAQVFCLPSHAEGLPMAMLEAMASGKAVVVTGVGAIPDAVQDRSNGLLVAPRDVPALAGALGVLLGDGALRDRLGNAGRATVQQRFSTGVVIGKISALYRELAA